MILVKYKTKIVEWLEENRPDKGSKTPYAIPVKVDGGYELPEDDLIKKGLKELEIEYTLIVVVGGWSFSVPSADIVEDSNSL